MTFALVQVNPFQVVQTFLNPRPPDPVIWPDGAATHGIPPTGIWHGPWALLPSTYTPAAPTQFHTVVSTAIPTFTGTSVVFEQTWIPQPLSSVHSHLLSTVRSDIAAATEGVFDAHPASLFVFQERLREARALADWMASTTAPPATTSFPLLFATVGVERMPDGSISTSVVNIMDNVLASYGQWLSVAAPLTRRIASAHLSISSCTTVIDSVNAFNNL